MPRLKKVSPDFRRWLKYGALALILALFMGVFFFFTLASEIYEYQDSYDGVHLPKVDAIVCLAGGRGRITAAADLWYRYFEIAKANGHQVPVLYFSGMGPKANWVLVSKQVRRGVLQKIRPLDVVIEKQSSNTYSNALWFAQYAQERRWKRVLLLTSSYHMKRARYIFEHVLMGLKEPVEVETFSVYQEPFTPDEWMFGPNGVRVTALEYLKWVYYRILWRF